MSWIKQLPDQVLIAFCHQDSIPEDIADELTAERWRRFSKPASEWPKASIKFHKCGDAAIPRGTVDLIGICPLASGPDDALHRPHLILNQLMRCSCGWRESISTPLRFYRTGYPVWPMVPDPWSAGSLYLVCPETSFADDPWHALHSWEMDRWRCICRMGFRPEDAKRLPTH